ncbi:MAG: substrate-specific activator of APC-dependent proteolysis [Sclerophora amabilis]|nr:MAG: substrate-specific activator of APC-dependent proteolysis [Sclerophora amabilis]
MDLQSQLIASSSSTHNSNNNNHANASQDRQPPLPLASPPATSTPPLQNAATAKRNHINSNAAKGHDRGSEPVNADALKTALEDFKEAGKQRERTPGGSPSRKRLRPNPYGDRFIPNREGQDLQASFSLLHDDASPSTPSRSKKRTPHGELHFQKTEEANRMFSTLLRSEIFDTTVPQPTPPTLSPDPTLPPSTHSTTINDPSRRTPPGNGSSSSLVQASPTPSTPVKNLFNYKSLAGHLTPSTRTPQSRHGPRLNARSEIYSLSPVHIKSQQMLLNHRKPPRAISKVPYKVLDAPDLADDFYLNLVDWGSSNVLGVGLGTCVYMWNSQSGRVTKLCDLSDDIVTSVSWIQRGSHVSIGTNKGYVQIWDAERCRRLRTMTGHTARVGALAWNDHILTSGSRDRLIYHRDVRQPEQFLRKLVGHKQEVCGLRWNCEDGQLASGGNDNKLMVWDKLSDQPLWKFSDHTAAVKAIAWSPHEHGRLASGGGTADRTIKFWNTLNGQKIQEVDTGSQVCNLAWSKNSNEIVSTHGYSQNQIVVWKYPSMTQVASLTGHTFRVLYLAMSPDGQVIVTGAGDETLRFWNCFKKKSADQDGGGSKMDGWGMIR